jgi:ferredoxin
MPDVRFVASDGQVLTLVSAVVPGVLLLDLARDHQLPLHWRCGLGTCGTCRVRLRHALQPREWVPAAKERQVMLRAGLIPVETLPGVALPDTQDVWRLACHVRIGQENLEVEIPPPPA